MEQITPEQAANETEALWKARAEGHKPGTGCGWCEFDDDLGCIVVICKYCPIHKLVGETCDKVAELYNWRKSPTKANAKAVYELLIENRKRLLDAAREILDEVNQ